MRKLKENKKRINQMLNSEDVFQNKQNYDTHLTRNESKLIKSLQKLEKEESQNRY